MRVISYSGEHLLTSNEVAASISELARLLGHSGEADAIEIPILSDGVSGVATLVVGPASQLVILGSDEPDVPLNHEQSLAELDEKIERLKSASVGPRTSFLGEWG